MAPPFVVHLRARARQMATGALVALALVSILATITPTTPATGQVLDDTSTTTPSSPGDEPSTPPPDLRAPVLAAVATIEKLARGVLDVDAWVADLEARRQLATTARDQAIARLVDPAVIAALDADVVAAQTLATTARAQAVAADRARGQLAVVSYMQVGSDTAAAELVPTNSRPKVTTTVGLTSSSLRTQATRLRAQARQHDQAAATSAQRAQAARDADAKARADLAAADTVLAAVADQGLRLWVAGPDANALASVAYDTYKVALAAAGLPAKPVTNPLLTILGPAQITPAELSAWATRTAPGPPRVASWGELASLYLDEGAAAGVRGDVAFVQAVIETGWFTNQGSSYYNFAGIGHCDSCANGFAYPDVRTGVRAQAQLLRFYADSTASIAALDRPAAISWLDEAYAKGCCVSWFGLTGKWATALHYGSTVLGLYEQALTFALANPVAVLPAPPS